MNPLIFHCVERHDETDSKTLERKKICWESWDVCYEAGSMIPCHYWNYARTADKVVGDKRPLPFLKDVLMHAMNQADDSSIIAWSNDDNFIHREMPNYITFHNNVYGPCTSFRSEFGASLPSGDLTPEQFDKGSRQHMGRDLFSAKKSWLVEHWDELPDFIIGCSDFDLMLACWVRLQYGIITTKKNIAEPIYPAEIPRGYIAHQYHQSHWSRPDYQDVAPGQKHNRKCFVEWAAKHLPDLRFTAQNTL